MAIRIANSSHYLKLWQSIGRLLEDMDIDEPLGVKLTPVWNMVGSVNNPSLKRRGLVREI
jgi:hypothetical protein